VGFEITLWKKYGVSLDEHQKRDNILYQSRLFKLHPVIMQYLFQQGLEETDEIFTFLYPTQHDFHDPYRLQDMKKAVTRIIESIERNEPILIFGDYDCDGITSTALLYKCLINLGATVEYKIPFRSEGYGLNATTIEQITDNLSLLITVDNGSTCHKAIAEASKKGIDVIVTDHHEISMGIPSCFAFINPKRKDNNYPCSQLAGAGVAFKLVHALHVAMNKNWEANYQDYIELAAIGTVADLAPLKGENRTICKLALEKMNSYPSQIFKNLFVELKIDKVTSSTISHQISPLINAQGRLGDPNRAVELLTSDSFSINHLRFMIELNNKRKQMTNVQFALCEEAIQEENLHELPVITLNGAYQKGCLGNLASKIAKKYRKPVVIIGENGAGSARNPCNSNISVLDTLNQCKEHLIKIGGHHHAAGFCIKPSKEKIKSFFAALQNVAKEVNSSSLKWYYTEQTPLEYSRGIFESLLMLEPFGKDFYQPIFLSPELKINEVIVFGDDGEHALLITDTEDKFYFYNQSSLVQNYKDQQKKFFYTSTLNIENEFILHAVEKQFNWDI
jgi:single-stranded-DNA-specific exonuclease